MFARLLVVLSILCVTLPLAATDLQRFTPTGNELQGYLGKGQWVVVKIWASDCHICNREAHTYQDFHEFNEDADVTVVGISLDGEDQQAAKGFIARHSITYPNLITPFMSGAEWFAQLTGQRFIGTPSFLIFDRQGKLRAQQGGAVPTEMLERFIEANDNS